MGRVSDTAASCACALHHASHHTPLLPLQHDLDNFLCHSCAPNTNVVIGKDLAAGLVAKYPLTPGDAITFDYDQTEDDLRDLRAKGGVDRGGFECNCGAEMCRGEILGRLFSPPLGAKKAAAAAACAAVGAGAGSSS